MIVAVVDTGFDIDHPDLKPNLWVNPGEVPGDGIDNDGNGAAFVWPRVWVRVRVPVRMRASARACRHRPGSDWRHALRCKCMRDLLFTLNLGSGMH